MADYEINVRLNKSQLEKSAQSIKRYIDKMENSPVKIPVEYVEKKGNSKAKSGSGSGRTFNGLIDDKIINEILSERKNKKTRNDVYGKLEKGLDDILAHSANSLKNDDTEKILNILKHALITEKSSGGSKFEGLSNDIINYLDSFVGLNSKAVDNEIKEISKAFKEWAKEIKTGTKLESLKGYDLSASKMSKTKKASEINLNTVIKMLKEDRSNKSDQQMYDQIIRAIQTALEKEGRDYRKDKLADFEIESVMRSLLRAGLEEKGSYKNTSGRRGMYGNVRSYVGNLIEGDAMEKIYGKEPLQKLREKVAETDAYVNMFNKADISHVLPEAKKENSEIKQKVGIINNNITKYNDYLSVISSITRLLGDSLDEIGFNGERIVVGSNDSVSIPDSKSGVNFHSHPWEGWDNLAPSVSDIKFYMDTVRESADELKEAYISQRDKLFKMDFSQIDWSKISPDKLEKELIREIAKIYEKNGGQVIRSNGAITEVKASIDDDQNTIIESAVQARIAKVLGKYGGDARLARRDANGNFVDAKTGEVWKASADIARNIKEAGTQNVEAGETMKEAAATMLRASQKMDESSDDGRVKIPPELRSSVAPNVGMRRVNGKYSLKPAKLGDEQSGLGSNAQQLLNFLVEQRDDLFKLYEKSTKDPYSKGAKVFPKIEELIGILTKYLTKPDSLKSDEVKFINAVNTNFNDFKLEQAKLNKRYLLESVTGERYKTESEVEGAFERIMPLLESRKISRTQRELFKGSLFQGVDDTKFADIKKETVGNLKKLNHDIEVFSRTVDITKGGVGTSNYVRTFATALEPQLQRIVDLEKEITKLRGQKNPDEERIDRLESEYIQQMKFQRKRLNIPFDADRASQGMQYVRSKLDPNFSPKQGSKYAVTYEDWEKMVSYYESENDKSLERQKLFLQALGNNYKRPQAYAKRADELAEILGAEYEIPSGKYSDKQLLDMQKELDYLREYRGHRQNILKPLNELYKAVSINPDTKVTMENATNVQDIVDNLMTSIRHVKQYLRANLIPSKEGYVEIGKEDDKEVSVNAYSVDDIVAERTAKLEEKKERLIAEENAALQKKKEAIYESLIDLPKEIELQESIIKEKEEEYKAAREKREAVKQMSLPSDEEAISKVLHDMIAGKDAAIKDKGLKKYYKQYLEGNENSIHSLAKDIQDARKGLLKTRDVENPEMFAKGTSEYRRALEASYRDSLIRDILSIKNRYDREQKELNAPLEEEREYNAAVARLEALKEELTEAQKIAYGYTEKDKKGKLVEVAPFQEIINEHNEKLKKIGADIDKSLDGLKNPPAPPEPTTPPENKDVTAEGEMVIHAPYVKIVDAEKTDVIKAGVVNVNGENVNSLGGNKEKEKEPSNKPPISKSEVDTFLQKISTLLVQSEIGSGTAGAYSRAGLIKLKEDIRANNNPTGRANLKVWKELYDRFDNLTGRAKKDVASNTARNEIVDLESKIISKGLSGDKRGLTQQEDRLSRLVENYRRGNNLNDKDFAQFEREITSEAQRAVAEQMLQDLRSNSDSLKDTISKNADRGVRYNDVFDKMSTQILNESDVISSELENVISEGFSGDIVDEMIVNDVLKRAQEEIKEVKSAVEKANDKSSYADIVDVNDIDKKINDLESIMFTSIRDTIGSSSEDIVSSVADAMGEHIEKMKAFRNSDIRPVQDYTTLVTEGDNLSKTIKNIKEINTLYEKTYNLRLKIAKAELDPNANAKYVADLKHQLDTAFSAIRKNGETAGIGEAYIEKVLGSNTEYRDYAEDLVRQIGKRTDDITKSMYRKKEQGFGYTQEFEDAVKVQKQDANNLIYQLLNIADAGENAADVLKQAVQVIDELEKTFMNAQSNKSVTVKGTQLSDLINKAKTIKSNTQGWLVDRTDKDRIAEIVNELEELQKTAPRATDEVKGLNRVHYDDLVIELNNIKGKYEELGAYGATMFTRIGKSLKAQMSAQIARYFSLYDIIRYVRTGVETIKQLDTAMVELRKVTEGTTKEYADFRKEVRATAVEIAATNKDLISSSADWARLGYSIKEATELAKDAQIFVNVGDGVDIKGATDMMITAMKAFKIEANDALSIVDAYNEIGNNYALSATDIGDAMQRSASVLAASNTSFNESIALITAADEILQDPEKVGTALRTIALRIRGAKSELEEMGEETEYVVQSTSKLRDLIKGYTSIGGKYEGFDIMEDEDTFKSLSDIIKGIGEVYDEMSDIDRTAMLEKLAGKNRSNALAAMLTNYKQIDKVLASIDESEGSALRENEHIVDSVEGRITILKTSAENFWDTFLNTDAIKNTISLLTEMLNVVTKIVDSGFGSATFTAIAAPLVTHKFFHPYANVKTARANVDTTSAAMNAALGEQDVALQNYNAAVNELNTATATSVDAVKEKITTSYNALQESCVKATDATDAYNEATRNLTSSQKAFYNAIKANVAMIAISVAISLLTKWIQKCNEAKQAVRDLADETRESNKSLDEYTRRIAEAKNTLNDEKSSTEEIISAKQELINIQNELNESYDNYNAIIKDVNSTLDETNELLIRQRAEQIADTLREARDTGSHWYTMDSLDNEYDNAINAFFGGEDAEGFALSIDGQWDKTYDNIDDLINAYKQIMREYSEVDSTYKWAAGHVESLEKQKDEYEDIALLYGENEAVEKYSQQYEALMKAYYHNIQEGTEQSEAAVKNNLQALWESASEDNNRGVKYWLESMFNTFFDEINDAQILEKWEKAAANGVSYGSRMENILGILSTDVEGENKQLTEADILSYLNGNEIEGLSDRQKEWLQLLKETIDEAGYELDEYGTLVHKFVSDGLVYGSEEEASTAKEIAAARENALASLGMTGEQFDSLGISTNEELDIWREIVDTVDNATDAVKLYELETNNLGDNLGASSMLKNMEEQYKPVFDSLAEAYKSIWSSRGFRIDKVTSEQLEGVRSNIESLSKTLKESGLDGIDNDAINSFILTLSNSKTTSEEAHAAFNDLATIVVDSLNPAMSNASGETANLMINTLKELGVVNAEAVVYSRLGYSAELYAEAKAEAARIGYDLDDDITSLDKETKAQILASETLMDYYQKVIIANAEHINTSEDVEQLMNLCDQLGITIVKMDKLNQLRILERDINNSSLPESVRKSRQNEYDNLLAQTIADFKQHSEVEWEDPVYDAWFGDDESGKSSEQDFDWIERMIKKIQRAVSNFGKVADAAYKKWENRIVGLTGKYESLQEEINIQQAAEQAYLAEANAVGLSETYASKVRDGLLDIETITNEVLKDQIQRYQEYYDKATDAADAVEDLRGEIANLAQARFDNITKQFEEMALAIDHVANRIGSIQNKTESEGYFESTLLIEKLLEGDREKLVQLNEEAKQLATSIDEAVTNGDIEYGSEQWWNMYDSLQNVNDEIIEMTASISDLGDQLRQLEWDKFDYIAESISRLKDENDFLVEVLQDENLMFEKNALIGEKMYANGNMSEAALAVQGLHVNNLKILEEENKKYANEIKEINKELADDPNNKKMLERRNELIDQQQSIIKGISDEKHAIKDLIQEGYETFLDYLQKSIDKHKQILEAQKSLYDYERNIAEQTKAIGDFQKQLVALGGDDSEENRARMQQLRDDLTKAEKDLQETEYERWLSDQEEMMDDLYSDFEKLINDKLDNVDELIMRAIDQTSQSSSEISKTIQDEADEFLYDLSNTSFGVNFDARISDAVTAVNSVENVINNMINAANINAQNELAQLQALAQTVATSAVQKASQIPQATVPTGNTGGNGGGGGTKTTAPSNDKQISNTEPSNKKNNSMDEKTMARISELKKLIEITKQEANKYTPVSPHRIEFDARVKEYEEELKRLQRGAYAKGGLIGNAIKKTGEDGIILARSGEEVLSIEKVKQMQEIFKLMKPLTNIKPNSEIMGNTTVNGMNITFDLPNVTSYEDFVNKAQRDPKFEKLVQSVTIGTSLGKSKLSKYSI